MNTKPGITLDQHFLSDPAIRDQLIGGADIRPDDIVLEIGAGGGFITSGLSKRSKKVIAIEMDERLKPDLSRIPPNVEVKFGNVLDLIGTLGFTKIVSNLPFSISEPLLKKLIGLDISKNIERAALLVSEHFYTIIKSPESKWSIITPLFYDITKHMDIPARAYTPQPRVRTVMILLARRSRPLDPTERILKGIMLQSDKKLKNALINTLKQETGKTKWACRQAIEATVKPALLSKRIDHLSNRQFISLVGTIPLTREQTLNNKP